LKTAKDQIDRLKRERERLINISNDLRAELNKNKRMATDFDRFTVQRSPAIFDEGASFNKLIDNEMSAIDNRRLQHNQSPDHQINARLNE